jgi:two-component system sensor histidine kinase HydH
MLTKKKNKQFWTGVPPWFVIGAVAVLLPIFSFSTWININRQKEKSRQLLLEKGAALIRSFEAGTRTGMMSMHTGGFQLQRLLTETAQQPDIVYLFVADIGGEILVHNNLKQVGRIYGSDLDFENIARNKSLMWRQVSEPDGTSVFEIFRKFQPTGRPMGRMRRHMMMGRQSQARQQEIEKMYLSDTPQIIFVGLDMSSIEEAHRADVRHAIIMGVILLLVGFSGITLLFLFQSYRSTKASLARIKAFSDNVVENIPIGLIALDVQQRIASFNHTAESVLQLSYREAMGMEAEQILPPELCTELKCPEIEDQVIEKEIDCTVRDGSIVPLEISASLLEDENKSFLGERNRRLASVGRLAAGVAHEIRNPLSSIKGFATYFKERYKNAPEDQQTANIMIQEVDRLNRVVGQLLEFARPVNVKPKSTDLNTLVNESVKLIERQATEKKITIKTSNSTRVEKIRIDSDRVNQVLLNLYLNAIESMEADGELNIDLFYNGETKEIEISVSDSGCGIPKNDQAKIFDPYFTTKASGTGLGLAIAHNIVEAMGGTIKVKSNPGKGTIFTITIPT